ncbi:TPA: hypothetical protein ACJ2XA_004281 [Kluyvera georgiana]
MSGIQCWDASGRMVADVGDYNIRYMGEYYLNVGGARNYTVGWAGMRETGWIIVIDTDSYWSYFYATPYNDQFIVRYLPTTAPISERLRMEIYKFK